MFPHFTFSGTTYQALHRKLTLFCTCVTQIILLALSALCVFVAKKNIKQGNETAFLTETSSVISHLQEQDVISHQWLNQLQENSSIQIYLYENGTPLFYDQYHQTTADEQLCENALLAAEELTGNPPFFTKNKRLSSHTEYQFNSGDNIPYIASVGSIPKGDSYLNFLILRSLAEQSHQMLSLRIIVIIANIAAFLLLFLFFHFFIRKMLEPVETAQKKQTQFIASASHELRTPLAVVRSGLESVEKCSNEEERNHFLHLMSEETVHMKRLIDDMLLLANSDADTLTIKPEACQPDAPEIAKGNYNLWRLMIDKAYQNRGYGKEAVSLALEFIKSMPCGEAEYCWLSYEPDNAVARQMYRSFGFEETGEMDGEELIAVLRLQLTTSS